MKAIRIILCFITTISLSISLLASGFFAVAYIPQITGGLSFVTCNTADSPFSRSQLSQAALATHDYTLGTHSKNSMYETLSAINDEAKTPYANATRTKLADAGEAYVLNANAFSHLDDCYTVILRARDMLAIAACVALVCLLLCGIIAKKRNLGRVLIVSSCIVIAGMLGIGAYALFDFNSFFATFHSLFFEDGTWTFPADSLLICMFPESFWVAMACIWIVVSLLACIICLIIGCKLVRSARKRAQAIQSQAYETVYANTEHPQRS